MEQDNMRFLLELDSSEKELVEKTSKIVHFYENIVRKNPYPFLEIYHHFDDYKGGYGQAGFLIMVSKHPLLNKKKIQTGHPLYIPYYNDFYLAHEIAHLWWGQALAWLTYQDQWISEGIAQYMAMRYIRNAYGENAYNEVLRKLSSSVKTETEAGPIILGRRLGLLTRDADAFGAIVYNKSAVALIMLEEIIGIEAFTRGLTNFYDKYQFKFATTADFIQIMQKNCVCKLDAFFQDWYFIAKIPSIYLEKVITDNSVELSIKVSPEFIVPLIMEFRYEDDSTEEIKVILSRMHQKLTFETKKRVKKITIKDIYPVQ